MNNLSYQDTVLIIRQYRSEKNHFVADDLADPEVLKEMLLELESGESNITAEGKIFLSTHFSKDVLASALEMKLEDFEKWFEYLVPMEIATFIQNSRNKID